MNFLLRVICAVSLAGVSVLAEPLRLNTRARVEAQPKSGGWRRSRWSSIRRRRRS
jgi:hypothetical protein